MSSDKICKARKMLRKNGQRVEIVTKYKYIVVDTKDNTPICFIKDDEGLIKFAEKGFG